MTAAERERVRILEEALVKASKALEEAAETLDSVGNYPNTTKLTREAAAEAWDAVVRATQAGLM